MTSKLVEDTGSDLEARIAKLERLAPHHRAHINALESLVAASIADGGRR